MLCSDRGAAGRADRGADRGAASPHEARVLRIEEEEGTGKGGRGVGGTTAVEYPFTTHSSGAPIHGAPIHTVTQADKMPPPTPPRSEQGA